MSYDLTFINGAGSRLFIAIKFYQPDECGQYGRPWGTRGWYVLEPNEEAEFLKATIVTSTTTPSQQTDGCGRATLRHRCITQGRSIPA